MFQEQIEELREERDRLMIEARALAETDLVGDDVERFADLETRITDLQSRAEKVREADQRLSDGTLTFVSGSVTDEDDSPSSTGRARSYGADPWSEPDREVSYETRSRALTAIERWSAEDELKESATATVERLGRDDQGPVSRHILRYSHPLYISAFRKFTGDPETFAASLTPEERRVWAEAREEQRTTLVTSGAVLPSPLDPTIVLTSDGSVDPMRALARVDSTTSDAKRYITSAGSTFSFDAENAEVSDDTFAETEVTINVEKAQGWIEVSLEVAMDQPDFSAEVAKIIADGKAQLESGMWITGTGTNQPKGVQVALAGGTSEINAAGEALVADDVYGLLEALPPRFRQNGRFQLELSTLNFIHRLWNPSGSEPPLVEGDRLLKIPYGLNSSVDPYSDVDDTATANNYVLFVGDWDKFCILDRVGLSVTFVPPGFVHNTTANRPDGRAGWYAYWRTGSDVLDIAPFRMLDVATTA